MTLYALIQDAAVAQVGPLPKLWWDGTRWHDWRDLATAATNPAASGWLPVAETARPADTATTTADYSVTLAAGMPTVTWTPRPWTAEELAARQQATTRDTLTADTTADLTKLREAIDSLALLLADNTTVGSIRAWKAPITNSQNVTGAQAKALADLLITDAQATRRIARQTLRLARSMVGDYSSADVGTA